MNSLLQARMEDLEDLKKEHLENLKETVSRRPHCDSLDVQHMAHSYTPLEARVEWCQRLRKQARTQFEVEGWRAEEEGLWDALLKRDRTYQHQYSRQSPPCVFNVFERYTMGLEDGQALIRLRKGHCIWHPAPDGTHP